MLLRRRIWGVRDYLEVPMLKRIRVVGVSPSTGRSCVRSRRSRIDLLSTFASQAVIAIENVRLSRDQGALERQTATAEIRACRRFVTDTQPVRRTS